MRKLLSLLLVVLLGLMPCVCGWATGDEEEQDAASEVEESGPVYAEVGTERGTLNMRKKPSATSAVLLKLPKAAIVEVVAEDGEWTEIIYEGETGYVKTEFLIFSSPSSASSGEELKLGDKSPEVKRLKKRLKELGYLGSSAPVNETFDEPLETALLKVALVNELPHTVVATPELQDFILRGKIAKAKTGYFAFATDDESDLSASVMGWVSSYRPDTAKTIECSIRFVTHASGGTAPYTVTVKKAFSYDDAHNSGTTVESPFSVTWRMGVAAVLVTVNVEDADGNTVSARARVAIVKAGMEYPTGYDGYGYGL